MKIAFSEELEPAPLWVIPFWEGPKAASDFPLSTQAVLRDFKGKNGEVAVHYEKEQRIFLLGLGSQDKASIEALRKAYASAAQAARLKKITAMQILFPKCKQKEPFFQGIAEGILLTNYSFTYKSEESLKEDPIVLLNQLVFVGIEKTFLLQKIQTLVQGVHFIRDLVSGNADGKMEQFLAAIKTLPRQIKVSLFDKKRLTQEGMGLILAVNRSSSVDPLLVQASYRGHPKSKEHIVLVGKGVLYDTGGLSLKTSEGMLIMKCDMAGAATVLGAIKTAEQLGLKVNVTALMPLTENCIGSKSFKLGDVYRSYSGKTVEITNTDGEGRLVLADAISYAIDCLKPSAIIDLATLTGACIVALGEEISALFSNDEPIAKELMAASERTGELICRLPIHAEYKEAFKSDIADLVNSAGRDAGAIKAALFLQEFIGTMPWAHLDIAGPAYLSKPKLYNPTRATGYGLRLLIDFLEARSS